MLRKNTGDIRLRWIVLPRPTRLKTAGHALSLCVECFFLFRILTGPTHKQHNHGKGVADAVRQDWRPEISSREQVNTAQH
jgi:hypothetical protein